MNLKKYPHFMTFASGSTVSIKSCSLQYAAESTITVTLPKWEALEDADEILKKKWEAFIKALDEKHEQGHVDIFKKYSTAIETKIKQNVEKIIATGEGDTKQAAVDKANQQLKTLIDQEIDNIVKTEKANAKNEGDTYDKNTKKGETQGAIWCNRQQPAPNKEGGPKAEKKEEAKPNVKYDSINKSLHFESWEIGNLQQNDPLLMAGVSISDFTLIGPEGTGFLFSGDSLTVSSGGKDYITSWVPFLLIDDVNGPGYGNNMFAVLFDMKFDTVLGSTFISEYTDFLANTNFQPYLFVETSDKLSVLTNNFQTYGETEIMSASLAYCVPEPSTLLLLGSGLAGLVVFGRKKAI